MSERKRDNEYSMGFGCYGMPLSVRVKVVIWKGAAKEGKEKRYCRKCMKTAIAAFADHLKEQLLRMELK